VVSHCIYGVDKNPMAIALAKTALWLEAYTPDRPLTFIDHHLQVGDALLGVLDPKILENGIPDEAYAVLSGDDKATAAALKKQNKADLKSWKQIAGQRPVCRQPPWPQQASAVEHAGRRHPGRHCRQAQRLGAGQPARHAAQHLRPLADTYVPPFSAPKVAASGTTPQMPLSGYLWGLTASQRPASRKACSWPKTAQPTTLCRQLHSVFHWWLAFPQVAAKGGFAVMLGNPPWERIKLQLDPQEFFAAEAPSIANAQHMAARNKMIAALETDRPHLFKRYWGAVRAMEAVQAFASVCPCQRAFPDIGLWPH
jgi:hypothetical protein